MTARALDKLEWVRVGLAALIAPSVPIGALALTAWLTTGNPRFISIYFFFGYLFFLVLGVPVIAMLVQKRRLKNCVVAGGVVTIAPTLLLTLLSFGGASTSGFSGETLMQYAFLFLAGCVGGALFWLIAFAGSKPGTALT